MRASRRKNWDRQPTLVGMTQLADCTLLRDDRPLQMQSQNTIETNTLRISSIYTVSVDRGSLFWACVFSD